MRVLVGYYLHAITARYCCSCWYSHLISLAVVKGDVPCCCIRVLVGVAGCVRCCCLAYGYWIQYPPYLERSGKRNLLLAGIKGNAYGKRVDNEIKLNRYAEEGNKQPEKPYADC